MDIKTTMSTSQARKDLFSIIEGVGAGQRYTLTQNGSPKAVVLGAEEFESIMETLDLMQTYPNLEKELKEARQDFAQGRYVTLEEFRQGKRTYVVSNRSTRTSTKRTRSASVKRKTKS